MVGDQREQTVGYTDHVTEIPIKSIYFNLALFLLPTLKSLR